MNLVVDLSRQPSATEVAEVNPVQGLLVHEHRVAPARWPRMLDRKQVAEYLTVSTATVERLVKDGIIPAPVLRLGTRLLRWDRASIDAALDNLAEDRAQAGRSFDAILDNPVVISSSARKVGRR